MNSFKLILLPTKFTFCPLTSSFFRTIAKAILLKKVIIREQKPIPKVFGTVPNKKSK